MIIDIPFIGNERLRNSLLRDIQEAESAMSSSNWKSAIVLYGCILEAIILDALISRKITVNQKGKPIENLELGPLIEVAVDNKLLTQEISMASMAIKNFRNLIHPGREYRLELSPNEGISDIARGLLLQVIEYITKMWTDKKRLTADEVLVMIKADPFNKLVIGKVISDMWEHDRVILLKSKIPSYFSSCHQQLIRGIADKDKDDIAKASNILRSICTSFHQGFDLIENDNKCEVLKCLCTIIRTGYKYHVSWKMISHEYIIFADIDDASLLGTAIISNWIETPDSKKWKSINIAIRFASIESLNELFKYVDNEISNDGNLVWIFIDMWKINTNYHEKIKESLIFADEGRDKDKSLMTFLENKVKIQ